MSPLANFYCQLSDSMSECFHMSVGWLVCWSVLILFFGWLDIHQTLVSEYYSPRSPKSLLLPILVTAPGQPHNYPCPLASECFLGATKLLYNWLCPLVGRSVTHSFDDPHVAPYWLLSYLALFLRYPALFFRSVLKVLITYGRVFHFIYILM